MAAPLPESKHHDGSTKRTATGCVPRHKDSTGYSTPNLYQVALKSICDSFRMLAVQQLKPPTFPPQVATAIFSWKTPSRSGNSRHTTPPPGRHGHIFRKTPLKKRQQRAYNPLPHHHHRQLAVQSQLLCCAAPINRPPENPSDRGPVKLNNQRPAVLHLPHARDTYLALFHHGPSQRALHRYVPWRGRLVLNFHSIYIYRRREQKKIN